MGADRGSGHTLHTLKNYKSQYVSLEILVLIPLEKQLHTSGPKYIGSNCFWSEVGMVICEISIC